MAILDLLIEAIQTRKPISFEYNKPNKTPGQRIGNTHAVFILTSKAGQISTKVHIVQTAGVSDTVHEKPFPDFRMFNIEDLSNIVILEAHPCFEPYHEKYNPHWEGYKDVIEKI
jgi:hypothetical protein